MKTSARNCFHGVISQIEQQDGIYQIAVQDDSITLYSHISAFAFARLQPKVGMAAVLMMKASALMLLSDLSPFRLSAENIVQGVVQQIEVGAVNNIVTLQLSNQQKLVASITLHSSEQLDVHIGQTIYAVFQANQTVLGII